MGFIQQFWRGQMGFIWTIVLLIGVSVVLSYSAKWAGWPVLIALGVASIWQGVGAVRFAERVLKDGALSRVYGVYAAMGVALISNVLVGIGLLLPQPPLDLSVDGYVPKVAVSGKIAYVTGSIEYQTLTELKAVEGLREVVLESSGGNVQAGRAIGLFLAKQGINTRVDAACFSACILAFAGGVQRRLGPEGQLGFHGYRFVDPLQVQTINPSEIEAKDREYLIAQGFDGAFVTQIFATGPADLWQPTREVLSKAGVLR